MNTPLHQLFIVGGINAVRCVDVFTDRPQTIDYSFPLILNEPSVKGFLLFAEMVINLFLNVSKFFVASPAEFLFKALCCLSFAVAEVTEQQISNLFPNFVEMMEHLKLRGFPFAFQY